LDAPSDNVLASMTALRTDAGRRPFQRVNDLLSLLVPRRRLSTRTLIPGPAFSRVGPPNRWRADTDKPMWLVPVSARTRYLELRFSARIVGGSGRTRAGTWRIYYDAGEGFLAKKSRWFQFNQDRIEIRAIMRLRGPAFAFRVDPTDFPCEFIVDRFDLIALRRVWALPRMGADRISALRRQGVLGEALGRWARFLAAGQVRKAYEALFGPMDLTPALYEQWVERRKVTSRRRAKFASRIGALDRRPVFSVIMPTYNSSPEFLERAIQSVKTQIYPHWELCIADDGSTSQGVRDIIRRHADDSRVKAIFLGKNKGISAASNAALAVAGGDYIALLDHDDELAPHALYAFAVAVNERPEADWLYSDEDKIDHAGRRSDPLFKPDWSPAFFQACMYTCHLGVYRRELALELGGFRSEFDLAQDYDLALRFARSTSQIVHVPDVLYHWRTLPQSTASGADAKPEAEHAARRALQAYLDSGPVKAHAEPGPFPGSHRPRYEIQGEPLVSIVIPSAGRISEASVGPSWFVLDLVRSIRDLTEYDNFEIIVADNDDFDPDLQKQLDALDVRRVVYRASVFNISEKMNLLVGAASGAYVVLLNDDMRVVSGGWLGEMLMWCQQSDVAAVGAKLIFPNEHIQHAGVLLLAQGPSHVYYDELAATAVGLAGSAVIAREYSVVTGACLMTRRADYLAAGGFDPAFRINYNDVDFCLRLKAYTGGRIIYTPYALLYHYEAVSKETAPASELDLINTRWRDVMGSDPYYNIHLSQYSSTCALSHYILPIESQYDFG
jgi:glycosyltransferase involved in cell wall biosynthesis